MSSLNINDFITGLRKKNFIKNLFTFLLGALISAFAFNLFYQRYNIVAGGSTGLAIIFSNFCDFDVSLIVLIIQLLCLVVGLIFFGWEYAIKMLAITFIYPTLIKTTSYVTDMINLEDTSLFLVMVVGGGLTGFGNGLIRNSGYSPGGFYSLYDVFKKYLHTSIGTASTIINGVVISAGGMIFGLNRAIYAIIGLLVSSYIVDRVTIGISDNKVFYIVTEKPFEVQEYVNDKLHYDITIVSARGGYTNKKKKMLMCVVPTIEYVRLKELVLELDNKAFFLIVDAYESSVRKKEINFSKAI